MEIEIDKKALIGWIIVLLILAAIVFAALNGGASFVERKISLLLNPSGGSGKPAALQSPAGRPSVIPTQASEATPKATGEAIEEGKVVFEDLSTKWDWEIAPDCGDRLLEWLRNDKWTKDHEIEKLVVGLVDEKAPEKLRPGPKGEEYNLSYAAALPYPPKASLDYMANGGCVVTEKGNVHCYVAPIRWIAVDGTLSAVTLVASLTSLEQLLRPKTRKAWDDYSQHWKFANYIPLITQEGSKWRTDCLRVRPQG